MNKRQNKSRNILKKALIFILLILLIILLLGYLNDLNKKIIYIAKYTHQQNVKIEKLELDIKRLERVAVYQYELITELKDVKATKKVEFQQLNQPQTQLEKEPKQSEKMDLGNVFTPTITVVTATITILIGIVKTITTLIPTV